MIETLVKKSQWLRNEVLELVVRSQKGHIPSSFSCADIVTSLYYSGNIKYDPKNPKNPDRDRVFVSKGHAAMVLYPILADLGFFSQGELLKFTQKNSLLRMYADQSIPGIEATTGSLGHGFGIGCGHALSAKLDQKNFYTYVILGDGECYEGSIWETALFASHHKLNNLVVFVDRNELCILDKTEDCLKLDSLKEKWAAFGWNTVEINGHSHTEIQGTLQKIKLDSTLSKPTAIIAHTIKGKGISFMEGDPGWHNRMMNPDQVEHARRELNINCIKN